MNNILMHELAINFNQSTAFKSPELMYNRSINVWKYIYAPVMNSVLIKDTVNMLLNNRLGKPHKDYTIGSFPIVIRC